MKSRLSFLFKPIDYGIKFEIILKIFLVALFSSLLMGSAVYKFFESSLIQKEKEHLEVIRLLVSHYPSYNKNTYADFMAFLGINDLWIFDSNYQPLYGMGSKIEVSQDLKTTGIKIIKKGLFLNTYSNIYIFIPVITKDHKKVFFLAGKDLKGLNRDLIHIRKIILYIVLLTTCLMIVLLIVLLRSTITEPLRNIINDINEIKLGNKKKLEGYYLKELNYLTSNFNNLLELTDSQNKSLNEKILKLRELNNLLSKYHHEMSKFEKLISVGELAAGIAHEIGNPINNISGYLLLLKNKSEIANDYEALDYITRIEHDVKRISLIIRNILDFSRKEGRLNIKSLSLMDIIDKTLELVFLKAKNKKIKFIRNYIDKTVTVKIDPNRFQQVLLNLFSNAIDSIEYEGTIEVKTEITDSLNPLEKRLLEDYTTTGKNNKKFIRITIHDDGKGIDKNDMIHIFDPFFTTKELGKGTGLGLSVSLQLIKEMKGVLSIDSEKGIGTSARVILHYESVS